MKQLRFESGEATIRPEGYQVLNELIAYINTTAGDRLIRVEGHADNQEIGPSLKSRYRTNWDLSKARAGGVLRYLTEKGGIDSAKLSLVGYGDTKPMASNATEEGRQKNRRVDIVLYSPESAKEQAEPATKAVETGDNGYSMSRLGSAETGGPNCSSGSDGSSGSNSFVEGGGYLICPCRACSGDDPGIRWSEHFRSESRYSNRPAPINSPISCGGSTFIRRPSPDPLAQQPHSLFPLFRCCYNGE